MQSALSLLSESEKAEYWASLALRYSSNLGLRSINKLMRHFGSALLAVQNPNSWDKANVSLTRNAAILQNSWRELASQEWNKAKELNAKILLWTDEKYPTLLKETPDAPLFLYYLGDIKLLNSPGVAIIGARKCSIEGRKNTAFFSKNLSENGITIISGLALGIDQVAHATAVSQLGSSIAVLGTGIDYIYPKSSTDIYYALVEKGLILSEFAPSTPPERKNFPIRNRIISALSQGVLVIEASIKSGSLITTRCALDQNKTVFAIPGGINSIYSLGCQELIKQGATPAFSPQDILKDLSPLLKNYVSSEKTKINVDNLAPVKIVLEDKNEQAIVDILSFENKALSIDDLKDELDDIEASELNSLLAQLEIQDIIERLPGQYYIIKKKDY